MSKKIKLEEFEALALTQGCSGIIQNKFPPKLSDPEKVSIPCTIGNLNFAKDLCDFCASVSSAKRLGLK